MASRVVEVLYKLKDLFTGQVKKITGGYREIDAASDRASAKIDRNTARTAGTFDRFTGAVNTARLAFSGFVTQLIRTAAVAAAGVVINRVKAFADELDRIGKVADRLNIDPSTLSAFGFVAERSGIAVSTMEKALSDLQLRSGEAAQGVGESVQAFSTLGINAEQFIELGLEEQMSLLADAFSLVTDEETKAALAAKVFGEAGVEVLQALNGGSAAFDDLLQKGKRFRAVTKEMTEAAAEFNDTMTNAGASVDGLKYKFLTPSLQGFNEFIGVLGLSADELSNIEAQIRDAQRRLKIAEFFGWESAADKAMEQIFRLQARLDDYVKSSMKAKEEEGARKKSLQEAAAANAEYEASVESLTSAYEEQAKARAAALKKETAELAAARSKQKSIEEEFARLREEVSAQPQEDVSGLDVQTKTLEARRRLAAGDAEGAIKMARQGGDLLRQLQSQGDEAGYVLSFLAKQLEEVANKAAQQQVDVEIIDEQQAQQALSGVTNKVDALKTEMVTKGTDIGKAFVAAINAGIASEPLQTPAVQGPTREITREGNSFNHSLRRELDRRGGK